MIAMRNRKTKAIGTFGLALIEAAVRQPKKAISREVLSKVAGKGRKGK